MTKSSKTKKKVTKRSVQSTIDRQDRLKSKPVPCLSTSLLFPRVHGISYGFAAKWSVQDDSNRLELTVSPSILQIMVRKWLR